MHRQAVNRECSADCLDWFMVFLWSTQQFQDQTLNRIEWKNGRKMSKSSLKPKKKNSSSLDADLQLNSTRKHFPQKFSHEKNLNWKRVFYPGIYFLLKQIPWHSRRSPPKLLRTFLFSSFRLVAFQLPSKRPNVRSIFFYAFLSRLLFAWIEIKTLD